MAYVIHGVGWLGSARLLSSAFSFVLVIAFANLLPAETYGTYSYVMAAVSIVVLTSLPGIESSLLRSVARGFEGSLFVAQRARLKWSSIGTTSLLVLSFYYWLQGNMVLGSSFLVSAVLFPFFVSFTQFSSYLNGKKLFRDLALHNLTVKFLFAIGLSSALIVTDNVAALVAVNMVIIALTGFILTRNIITKHKVKLNTHFDTELIGYGKHLTVMSILETIGRYMDKILLWHFFGPVHVAVWAFAYSPIQIAQAMVKRTLVPLALPKFSQNNFLQTKQQLPAKVIKLFLLLTPFAAGYALIAPILFEYFFAQYLDSVSYSQILVVLILLIPFNFFSGFLFAQARKRDLYIIKISFGITLVTALIVFIPLWGLWGAVAAHIMAMSLRSLTSWILFLRF